jgi:hypothetical protein
MNNDCNKEWTRKFITEVCTKTFINNEWKKVREQVLYDYEKALLPATQEITEQRKQKMKIRQDIADLDKVIAIYHKRRHNLVIELNTNRALQPGHVRKFIRACPDEDCRGFLSTQWKCGTCEKWTCSDCHLVKGHHHDSEHTCNPDDVETAKLLSKDTKPCPKCSSGIYKIEGCDQMWCTICHTAFSWRTGNIETAIHNPHFYEWQRLNNNGEAPRNQGDLVCGRELDYRFTTNAMRLFRTKMNDDNRLNRANYDLFGQRLGLIIQSLIHLQQVQLETYRVDHVVNNQELRIRYLLNDISEDGFRTMVQRANKLHEKKREISQVLHLFIQTVTDIGVRLEAYLRSNEGIVAQADDRTPVLYARTSEERDSILMRSNQILDESIGIRDYVNELFTDIAKTYSSKPKAIRFYTGNDTDRNILI